MANYLKTELYKLIKKDERIFDFIQLNSIDGLWFWDLEKPENKWLNLPVWKILGYTTEAPINNLTAWQSHINQEDNKTSLGFLNKHLTTPNDIYKQDIRFTNKNGEIVWLSFHGLTITNEHGTPTRMFGTVKDITEQKESKEKFKHIFEASPIAIQLYNSEGHLLEVNQQTLNLFGIRDTSAVANYNFWESPNLSPENIEKLQANKPITISSIFDFEIARASNIINSAYTGIKHLEIHVSPIHLEMGVKGYLVHIIDETEQANSKKDLQNQIELFDTIINTVPSRIFWKDLQSKYLGCNAHFAQDAGVQKGTDIVGKSDFDMIWKADADLYIADDKEVMQTGISKHNYSEPFTDKNGEKLIWSTSKLPLKNKDGEIFGLVGVSKNITEQVKANERIKESEKNFRSIFEHANAGIAIFNINRTISKINIAYVDIMGYSKEEFLKLNCIDTIHPEDYKKEMLLLQNVYDNKSDGYRMEKRLKHKNGNYVWLDANITSIRNSNDNIEKFLELVVDITEKKKATETMNIFFEQTMNLHAISKLDGTITKVNNGWYTILGYKKEEVEGTNSQDLVHPDDLERTISEIKNLEQGKTVYYFENRCKHKLGHYLTLAWSANTSQNSIYAIAKDITEEKNYYEALIKSEEKYKALSENAKHITITHKFDGEITYINQYALDFLGLSKEDALGSDIKQFISTPIDLQKHHESRNGFAKGNIELSKFELPVTLPNGKKGFLDVVASPIKENNTIEAILLTAYDTTYKKESEFRIKKQNEEFEVLNEELRLTNNELFDSIKKEEVINERFNLAMQATSDGLWDWDFVTNKVYFSPTYKGMLGYRDNELENDFSIWETLTEPKDVKKVLELLDKLINNKDSKFDIEFKMKHKNGHWVDISSRAKIFFNKEQKPIRIVGTHTDVTLKKLAEKQLIESEEKLRRAIDDSPLGISMNDLEGNYLSVNKAFENMIGYTEDELKKLSFYDISDSNCVRDNNKLKEELFTHKKKAFALEKTYVKKNGETIPVRIHATTLISKDSEPIYMAFIEDISDEKKALKDIKTAKEKAEESNLLKTEFLHNMSHEIRTPMNGIMGFSALLYDIEGLDEEQINYISIIQNSSKQLLQIIDDILEISTLETKQLSIQESEFNVNHFIMELFAIYDLKSKERNIPLYIKKDLKNENSLIISDKTKIHKILTNLLDNSFKFTSEGKIEFGYKINKSNIIFYVTDTGIGISQDKLTKIFERFSQESSETALTFGGLGLGLSIAKENTELLNGKITVESTKGEGSTFYVEIPYNFPENLNFEDPIINEREKPADVFNILIAEDEEINYLYLEAILTKIDTHEIKLQHAINGKEALDICTQDNTIDLVLMDIKMPIMDGYIATKEIKALKPNIPIIAQTAYSTDTEKEMAMEAGCDDFISKPIKKDQLLLLILKYIKS